MAKLLTLREGELFRMCVNLAYRVDEFEAHQERDVRSRLEIAQEVENKLSFNIDEDDVFETVETAGVFPLKGKEND